MAFSSATISLSVSFSDGVSPPRPPVAGAATATVVPVVDVVVVVEEDAAAAGGSQEDPLNTHPAAHSAQREVVLSEQVVLMQPAMLEHAPHVRSATAVHAAISYVPLTGHTLQAAQDVP